MYKDMFAPFLGKQHRILGHDDSSNLLIAMLDTDPIGAYIAGTLHDIVDRNMKTEEAIAIRRKERKGRKGEIDPLLTLLMLANNIKI